jgi:hypothetical protein
MAKMIQFRWEPVMSKPEGNKTVVKVSNCERDYYAILQYRMHFVPSVKNTGGLPLAHAVNLIPAREGIDDQWHDVDINWGQLTQPPPTAGKL